MNERAKFALEWEKRWDAGKGVTNVAQLCREFGISRDTGYVWLRRFRDAGHDVKALDERSRRQRPLSFGVSGPIDPFGRSYVRTGTLASFSDRAPQ